MLVLSRKSRQSVMVGGVSNFEQVLKVTVVEIRGGSVSLGFDVSADVPVHRAEVWDRIRAENEAPKPQLRAGPPREPAPYCV